MVRVEQAKSCYLESSMETYITIFTIYSQWEFALWLRKLKHGLCINLEGWDGEGDGKQHPDPHANQLLIARPC